MTHDELLELLDEHMVFAEGLGPIVVLALRAVVELHKPVIVLTDDPVIVCSVSYTHLTLPTKRIV